MVWHWWGAWYPWAEENQGLISVIALIVALALFLVENRRANLSESLRKREQQQAQADARVAEKKAKIAAQVALIEKANRELAEFTTIVEDLIDEAVVAMTKDADRLHGSMAITGWQISDDVINDCRGIADSLMALIPTAPRDSRLIYRVQQAAALSRRIAEGLNGPASYGEKQLRAFAADLVLVKAAVTKRSAELVVSLPNSNV